MAYEEDFIDSRSKKVEIDVARSQEGDHEPKLREFKLKLLTGQDKDRIVNQYVSITQDENIDIDIAKKNTLWLKKCVLDAPYDKDDKDFKELSPDERNNLLNKLRPHVRDKLLNKIFEINEVSKQVKKK